MNTTYDVTDLITDIIPHLSVVSLFHISSMIKKFNHMIYHIMHLKIWIGKDANLDNFRSLIELEFYNDVQSIKDFSIFTNLTKLVYSTEAGKILRNETKIIGLNTLTNLTYLDLTRSNVVSEIHLLTNLTYLNIDSNYKIDNITTLVNLTELDMRYTDIKCISQLTNLSRLYMTHNEDIIVKSMTKLTHLSLHTDIINIDISNLTNLIHLNLSFNNVITDISMLTNLTYLNLTGNRRIKDVSTLTNLRTLILVRNRRQFDLSNLIHLTEVKGR